MKPAWICLLVTACGFPQPARVCDDGGTCASVDAADVIDAPSCWPFAPVNYAPCDPAFPPSMGRMDITADMIVVTDGLPSYDGGVVLFHVDELDVQTGHTLTFQGDRPVLVVADSTITVFGTIIVSPTATVESDCNAASYKANDTATAESGGGGGGGFGESGGMGGRPFAPAVPTVGGDINGDPKLSPLRPGCPGGKSGDAKGGNNMLVISGVAGGQAGGALELTAKDSITIGGSVLVNGGAGPAGRAEGMGANCPNTTNACSSGGGGGGSGGAIVLQSVAIEVQAVGSVCAVGGGGGGGGGANAGVAGPGGTSVSTTCVGGRAGPGGLDGGSGGVGGSSTPPNPGGAGVTDTASGGGGGGGVGRIRILSSGSPALLGGKVVPTPAQN